MWVDGSSGRVKEFLVLTKWREGIFRISQKARETTLSLAFSPDNYHHCSLHDIAFCTAAIFYYLMLKSDIKNEAGSQQH